MDVIKAVWEGFRADDSMTGTARERLFWAVDRSPYSTKKALGDMKPLLQSSHLLEVKGWK